MTEDLPGIMGKIINGRYPDVQLFCDHLNDLTSDTSIIPQLIEIFSLNEDPQFRLFSLICLKKIFIFHYIQPICSLSLIPTEFVHSFLKVLIEKIQIEKDMRVIDMSLWLCSLFFAKLFFQWPQFFQFTQDLIKSPNSNNIYILLSMFTSFLTSLSPGVSNLSFFSYHFTEFQPILIQALSSQSQPIRIRALNLIYYLYDNTYEFEFDTNSITNYLITILPILESSIQECCIAISALLRGLELEHISNKFYSSIFEIILDIFNSIYIFDPNQISELNSETNELKESFKTLSVQLNPPPETIEIGRKNQIIEIKSLKVNEPKNLNKLDLPIDIQSSAAYLTISLINSYSKSYEISPKNLNSVIQSFFQLIPKILMLAIQTDDIELISSYYFSLSKICRTFQDQKQIVSYACQLYIKSTNFDIHPFLIASLRGLIEFTGANLSLFMDQVITKMLIFLSQPFSDPSKLKIFYQILFFFKEAAERGSDLYSDYIDLIVIYLKPFLFQPLVLEYLPFIIKKSIRKLSPDIFITFFLLLIRKHFTDNRELFYLIECLYYSLTFVSDISLIKPNYLEVLKGFLLELFISEQIDSDTQSLIIAIFAKIASIFPGSIIPFLKHISETAPNILYQSQSDFSFHCLIKAFDLFLNLFHKEPAYQFLISSFLKLPHCISIPSIESITTTSQSIRYALSQIQKLTLLFINPEPNISSQFLVGIKKTLDLSTEFLDKFVFDDIRSEKDLEFDIKDTKLNLYNAFSTLQIHSLKILQKFGSLYQIVKNVDIFGIINSIFKVIYIEPHIPFYNYKKKSLCFKALNFVIDCNSEALTNQQIFFITQQFIYLLSRNLKINSIVDQTLSVEWTLVKPVFHFISTIFEKFPQTCTQIIQIILHLLKNCSEFEFLYIFHQLLSINVDKLNESPIIDQCIRTLFVDDRPYDPRKISMFIRILLEDYHLLIPKFLKKFKPDELETLKNDLESIILAYSNNECQILAATIWIDLQKATNFVPSHIIINSDIMKKLIEFQVPSEN